MDAHLQKLLFNLFCFTILLLIISGNQGVRGDSDHHHRRLLLKNRHLLNLGPNKLFVFGDSYADTGNNPISAASSWKSPYGITFPGKPAGRFSDGRVLTDYLAEFVGVKSPIPYRWRKVGYKQVKYGMNLANGGTGVFQTIFSGPNMTTQIDLFQQVINVEKVYTQADLQNSLALVTLSGNDYSTYLARNGSIQGLQAFIPVVVNQLAVNLDSIRKLGIRKIALTGLQPLGCLPRSTVSSSFQRCNDNENALVNLHNSLLQQAVAKLNNNQTKDAPFVVLDLYTAFMTVFQNKGDNPGSSKFQNPLKPCCVGISSGYSCGSVDDNGVKKYTVCDDPESAFFWDGSHPSQAGWSAVYTALQTTLEQIY
ncbi:putative carboxylic ester hydrolase [Tripterygium wilfordii]|uniref:Putative carboxylic ester hydrolase n=1 Tax=Tripterygium wilfordii TaxID=458696 RepID=A0A7J7CU97_TRIWF|nr:GDSL esterase/lipase At5g03610-like [Tripterygium wilfordii]KAF5737466.1 putative carboxylic ester hydrolase [Tripterygium wilfordii]